MHRWSGFLIVLLSGLLVVPACGRIGPPDANELRDLTVEVTFPAGASVGSATLSTPYGSGPLTGGGGKASVTGNGAALASVESGGRTLLMGFISDEMVRLDTRTTAEVFAFYYLNGQFLEPAMQESLLDFLSRQPALGPVVAAVEEAILADPPNVSIDDPAIADALGTMAEALAPEPEAMAGTLNLTISPDYQSSGIIVRETAPLVDVINVYNGFRRPVHVFVDRSSPTLGAVTDFPLGGAAIEEPSSARSFQHFSGFAQGSVPRSAIRSHDVAVPGVEGDLTTIYVVTVVGAGGDLLSSTLPAAVTQTAKDLAMRTAIERFLAPTIASALEFGAQQRTADDLTPILQGLSSDTIRQIEEGDFALGIDNAFAELFNSSSLPTTVSRILAVYYPNIRSRDGLQEMGQRLTRNLSRLVGATANSVSTGGSGIISTIRQSKRVETFTVVAKPISLRLNPEQSTIGTGGQVVLTAAIRFPEGVTPADIRYRYSIAGAFAGYATDAGIDKAFPFETDSTVITYKHRDTINIAYGTDTITIEALQNQNGIPTVVATGTASVTVKESTISLSPQTVELDFGQEQTFTATVDPMPASGTLSYVFVTYGASAFAGGSQTSVGASNSVVFVEADTEEGTVQPVTVTVVLDNEGTQTVLGQAQASVTFAKGNDYVLASTPDGTGGIAVDDLLEVRLNGTVIYADGYGTPAGTRPPIHFSAEPGDVLRFEVRDSVGVCRGLSTIYLVKGDSSTVATPGLGGSCGHPLGDHGVVYSNEFTIRF